MQIKWLSREQRQNRATAEHEDHETQVLDPETRSRKLTISLLTFGTFDQCGALLTTLCPLLDDNEDLAHLDITIIVRNNNPKLDSTLFDRQWQILIDKYDRLHFMMFNDGVNVGYGNGHNLNFAAQTCDYFLVLNDDLGLRDVSWLATALAILENDQLVAGVGAANSPSSLTPFFANGVEDWQWHRWPLRYIEGSVAVFRASAFAEAGKFDPAYEWVLMEDSDLSFRIQALGWRLEWIDIPHEHWRGSSISTLPGQTKSSILEHNRAVLFSKWNTSISQNRIGRFQIYDLWSDGIGDVFLSSLHLKSYLDTMDERQKSSIIVNTSSPDLVQSIVGDQVVLRSVADPYRLASSCSDGGMRSANSLRELNYSLPFNLHALVCGALAIPVASRENLQNAIKQRRRKSDENLPTALPEEPYCVVHLESERPDHDGRGPSPTTTSLIASIAAEIFPKLVLVGRTKHVALDDIATRSAMLDLRGRLSPSALMDVIASADAFVGLDSFPAHIAQVFGIRSILFFGAIHPSFRVLSTGTTWPIVKDVGCIGCYHTLLEPAIPFCLRRDLSCTRDIPERQIRNVMESCAAFEAFDWRGLEMRALELQQQFLITMFFHPDPQRRFLNVTGTPQHATTRLVEQVVEQVRGHLLSGGNHDGMASSIMELDAVKREIHRKDVQIESMVKLIAKLRAENGRARPERPAIDSAC